MASTAKVRAWEEEFDRWLEPFLERLGRAEQRHWAPIYLEGLLSPGERKSVTRLAERVAPGESQQLHHFVSISPWDPAPLEESLVVEANRLVGGPLAELDRVRAAGARFGYVLADADYGSAAEFRKGLSERGLVYAVGILATQLVYPADVSLVWPQPEPSGGRPRRHPTTTAEPVSAEAMIEGLGERAWRRVSWRRGSKGRPLSCQFAAVRVRVADGPRAAKGRHLPGEEELWLVCERRARGERKYYLSNLPATASLRELASVIKARWVCEQAHQQMKQELGLDHFEGRSWRGLHHHALLSMIAFAFLQHLRLGGKARAG